MMERGQIVVLGLGLTLVGLMVLLWTAAIEEGRQWEAFVAEHDCKVVARMKERPTTSTGFDARGNVTVIAGVDPARTAWLCDDGVTYWR